MADFPEHLETMRLSGERISTAHFVAISTLHRDPAVMKTLSVDGLPLSDEQTRAGIHRQAAHWVDHGFGFWVFRLRKTGQFLGQRGLMSYDINGTAEVGFGYAVVSTHWNCGYATEMAEAARDVGFRSLNRVSLDSWALPANHTSQRVLQKLGFRFEGDIAFAGLQHRVFRLWKTDWETNCDQSSVSSSSSRPASDVIPQTD